MLRYVTLPGPLTLVNPATDEPALDADGKPAQIGHASVVRTLMADPQLRAMLDVCDLFELRAKMCGLSGSVVELTEPEHAALLAVVRRPATATTQGATQFLTDAALCSPDVMKFFKAILNASTERPASHDVATF
jgi:hypothetical protein